MQKNNRKWFGDKAFYRMVVGVTLPILIQNGFSTFVNMLDNLMVGRLGTEAMSGVSVVNQFLFIFNLMIFGATSAAGIFMAQFHGNGDVKGERDTFRFKFLVCLSAGVLGAAALGAFSDPLISLFLKGTADVGDPALTLSLGRQYLFLMLIGVLPFTISNVYASAMRETGDTVTPMVSGIISVVINFTFNYLLMFGPFGLPRFGVRGAAAATVIARVVECLILVIRTHLHADRYRYIAGAYRSLRVPLQLARDISLRGMPLMANEFFWSLAITLSNQCYSTRGLEVVAAQSIFSTLWNVFSVVYIAMGSAIAIVVGKLLGAGKFDEARDTDRKMVVLSVLCGTVTALLLAGCSGVFPMLYNTEQSVRSLATYMIVVSAVVMPFDAFSNAAYFTIRSGGQVLITVLFDSGFMWAVLMPVCFALTYFTDISIFLLFAICHGLDIFKALCGFLFLRRGTWVRRLVS